MSAEIDLTSPVAPIEIRNDTLPAVALFQLLLGAYTTQLVYVAAALRLADLVAEAPATVTDLAGRSGADEPSLARLMTSLCSIGIFRRNGTGMYEMTPMAELLREDVPGSMLAGALYQGSPWHWSAFGALLERIRTGVPSFDHVHGAPFYDWLSKHPDAAAVFDDAMRAFSAQSHLIALAPYDFSQIRRVVDVGGGTGTLLQGIMAMHPHLIGTVFDVASVTQAAQAAFADAGMSDRADAVEGDFFQSVPCGADCYLLSMILVDYDDDDAIRLLCSIRAAMAPGSRLLVLEMLMEDDNAPSFAKLGDLDVLVTTRGITRTRAQLERLFDAAGLSLQGTVPSMSPVVCMDVRLR